MLLVRLVAPARRSERLRGALGVLVTVRRIGALLVVAATIVVLVAVAISGRDGGRIPGAPSAPPVVQPWMIWIGAAMLVLGVALTLVVVRSVERRSRRIASPADA